MAVKGGVKGESKWQSRYRVFPGSPHRRKDPVAGWWDQTLFETNRWQTQPLADAYQLIIQLNYLIKHLIILKF